jgi:hypothetical protein
VRSGKGVVDHECFAAAVARAMQQLAVASQRVSPQASLVAGRTAVA